MGTPKICEPKMLSPSNSTRRRRSSSSSATDASTSPEFEFWMVRNPSFPQTHLLSADELFVDGVLLPLHLLSHKQQPDPPDPKPSDPHGPLQLTDQDQGEPETGLGPEITRATTAESESGLTSSKRWKDIFKKSEKKSTAKNPEEKDKEKEKEKKREKRSQTGASSAELNINIWPFSRSRSAGNSGTRPKIVSGAATRKVNSAPCSRSNSAGESKSRKWPSSPGRPGVHLGRSSPIWQVKRGLKNSEPVVREKGLIKKDVNETRNRSRKSKLNAGGGVSGIGGNNNGGGDVGSKVKVLNLNVPMCIGYRNHSSCRSDENSAVGGVGVGSSSSTSKTCSGNGAGNVTGSSGNLFNLRNLFTKKVY